MTIKIKKKIKIIIPLLLVITLVIVGGLSWSRSHQDKFTAPRSEAPEVKFRVSKENTIMAVTGNLHYYGFVKDEDALLYALKHTQDDNPGKEGAIKVGDNTIDTEAVYTISQTMSVWEIAKILLNESIYSPSDCSHGCPKSHPFIPEILPGGDVALPIQEQMRAKYDWVTSYEACVEAIGHDGGQLSSEQYYEQTGIRRCISPDGREFTEGREGRSDQPSP